MLLAGSATDLAMLVSFQLLGFYRWLAQCDISDLIEYVLMVLFLVAYPFINTVQMTSVILTVATTIIKFIGVRFPYHSRRAITHRRAKFIIVTAIFLSVCYGVPKCFEISLNDLDGDYSLESGYLYNNDSYRLYFRIICEGIIFIVVFVATAGLNVAVIVLLQRRGQKQLRQFGKPLGSGHRTSVMLIVHIFMFVLTNLPSLTFGILDVVAEWKYDWAREKVDTEFELLDNATGGFRQIVNSFRNNLSVQIGHLEHIINSFENNFADINKRAFCTEESYGSERYISKVTIHIAYLKGNLSMLENETSIYSRMLSAANDDPVMSSITHGVWSIVNDLLEIKSIIRTIYQVAAGVPVLEKLSAVIVHISNLLIAGYCAANTLVFYTFSREYRKLANNICKRKKQRLTIRSQNETIVTRL